MSTTPFRTLEDYQNDYMDDAWVFGLLTSYGRAQIVQGVTPTGYVYDKMSLTREQAVWLIPRLQAFVDQPT